MAQDFTPASTQTQPGQAGSPPPLLSRLQADQSQRWQRGDLVRVEDYLAEHPGLADDSDALLGLILAEVILREERGDTPTVDEYVARFPAHEGVLRRQWGLARFLERHAAEPATTLSDRLTIFQAEIPPVATLPTMPGYEIVSELGRGGM